MSWGRWDSGLVFMQRFGAKSWRSSGLMPFRWKPWHHRPKRLPPPVFGRGSLCYIHFGIRGSPFRTGFKITCQSLSKLLDLAQVDPVGARQAVSPETAQPFEDFWLRAPSFVRFHAQLESAS